MFARFSTAIAGCALLLSPASAVAQQIQQTPDWAYNHHMWGGPMWGAGMIFGPLFMLLLLALLIAAVVMAVRWFSGTGYPNSVRHREDPGPVDILKQRFARGDIDKADYEERLKMLQG